MFLAPLQPLTLHCAADPTLSYHFSNTICKPQIFLESLLIGLQSFISVLQTHYPFLKKDVFQSFSLGWAIPTEGLGV